MVLLPIAVTSISLARTLSLKSTTVRYIHPLSEVQKTTIEIKVIEEDIENA